MNSEDYQKPKKKRDYFLITIIKYFSFFLFLRPESEGFGISYKFFNLVVFFL